MQTDENFTTTVIDLDDQPRESKRIKIDALATKFDTSGPRYQSDKNYNKAFKSYSKSARSGCALAQNNLGDCYYYGLGVRQDLSKAFEWYSKSAKNGNALAQDNVG